MKRLGEEDKERVLAYLRREREMNTFFLGDIYNCGLAHSIVKVFGEPAGDSFASLLLIYRNTMDLVYAQSPAYPTGPVLSQLQQQKKITAISGKEEIIKKLVPFLPGFQPEVTYLLSCSKPESSFLRPLKGGEEIRELKGEADFGQNVDLINTIEEFSLSGSSYSTPEERQALVAKALDGVKIGNRTLGLFLQGLLVASVSLTASYQEGGMLVSVCTRKGYRGRGYVSHLAVQMCEEEFRKGKKSLCLFYDNPIAGSIYRKIGFTDRGNYLVLHHLDSEKKQDD
jgi:predicted GNAT family acetyltransferase